MSAFVAAVDVVLSIFFVGFIWAGFMRTAGVLEWSVSFVGACYLGLFWGWFWPEFAETGSGETGRKTGVEEGRSLLGA